MRSQSQLQQVLISKRLDKLMNTTYVTDPKTTFVDSCSNTFQTFAVWRLVQENILVTHLHDVIHNISKLKVFV